MADQEGTALLRFLERRGPHLLGTGTDRTIIQWMNMVGGLEVGVGLPLLAAGLFASSPLLSGIGWALAGTAAVHLAWSAPARRRLAQRKPPIAQMPSEATGLLLSLLGRNEDGVYVPRQPPTSVLTKDALDILEQAAWQYNRIDGALVTGGVSSAALANMAASIRSAADGAMGEVLQAVVLMSRFPEASQTHVIQARARAQQLADLAGHVERLLAEGGTIPKTSLIEVVLEQLQQDQAARQELAQSEQETEMQTLRSQM